MIESKPKVSVITNAYPHTRHLATSVQSVLDQTFGDFELIVLVDGAVDRANNGVLDSFGDPRIHVIHDTNAGTGQAINAALQAARGEYVAMQDPDDVAHPQRLEQQVLYLDSHPDVVLVGSWWEVIDARGNVVDTRRQPTEDPLIRWQLLIDNCFAPSSMVFRREIALRVGGYEPGSMQRQDDDMVARLSRQGLVQQLPAFLCQQRAYEGGMSPEERRQRDEYCELVSHGEIERLHGKGVSQSVVNLLRIPIKYAAPGAVGDMADAGEMWQALYKEFVYQFAPEPRHLRAINRDVRERFVQMARAAFIHDRRTGWRLLLKALATPQPLAATPRLGKTALKFGLYSLFPRRNPSTSR